MGANSVKFCLNCGRSFVAHNSKHPFCSLSCKKRYENHTSFDCSQCRTVSCKYRNRDTKAIPDDCPNYKWHVNKYSK